MTLKLPMTALSDPASSIPLRDFAAIWPRCFLLAAAAAAAMPTAALADTTIRGSMYADPGNSPYGSPVPSAYPNAAGAYTLGPYSGAIGGNSAESVLTLQAFPQPAISATATGSSDGREGNLSRAQVDAFITYDLAILGPVAGVAVPVLFSGSTAASFANAGDPSGWVNRAGTQIQLRGPDNATTSSFHTVGPQVGTAADIYYSNTQTIVRASWGQLASGPVSYSEYSASFLFGATLHTVTALPPVGTQTLTISEEVFGADKSANPDRGTYSLASTTAFVDPYVYIDPTWLAANPGYSVFVDPGVGNGPLVTPVPEPSSFALMLAGMAAIGTMVRRRSLGLARQLPRPQHGRRQSNPL